MEILYVNNNGDILENKGRTIETGNRGYLYGDGLFETIRIIHGRPLSLSSHILRLKEGMTNLKMRIPSFFTLSFFEERIFQLIEKSKINKGGKIRLSVDRLSGGTYLPETNEVSYFVEVYPEKEDEFILNTKGKEVGLYTQMNKQQNALSNFKTKNSLLNVMASLEAKERGLDDVLLLNPKGNVIEAVGSNFFVVSNGILYTPRLEDGCVGGIMRMTIINIALSNNIKVYESSITPQNLLSADEIFLTNAVSGIVWVSGFRTRQYKNSMANRLVHLLNQHADEGEVCNS